MAHTHLCRFCDESFICPKGADECYGNYFTCGDCGGGALRFLLIAGLTFTVIFLTALFFKLITK